MLYVEIIVMQLNTGYAQLLWHVCMYSLLYSWIYSKQVNLLVHIQQQLYWKSSHDDIYACNVEEHKDFYDLYEKYSENSHELLRN